MVWIINGSHCHLTNCSLRQANLVLVVSQLPSWPPSRCQMTLVCTLQVSLPGVDIRPVQQQKLHHVYHSVRARNVQRSAPVIVCCIGVGSIFQEQR
eukprot:scaffold6393_cov42-Prasinocladus_malaysianus.AAC.1